MESYDKKILYLDYLERGNKMKNAGFVKLELRGDKCRVQIQLRGLYATDTLLTEILLLEGEQEHKSDTMMLHYGTGTYFAEWSSRNMGGCGIRYEECTGIRIRLSEHRVIQNIWKMEKETQEEKQKEKIKQEPVIVKEEGNMQKIYTEEGEAIQKVEEMHVRELQEQAIEKKQEAILNRQAEKPLEMETWRIEKPIEAFQTVEIQRDEESQRDAEEVKQSEQYSEERLNSGRRQEEKEVRQNKQPLFEDKWKQLGQVYPAVRPFGDNRTYLSIKPRDFIILARQYQNLVNNSFLLHGYYNYGHVILSKNAEEGEEEYYLGVPGIYHEREKQVAVMFGFEGFEPGFKPAAQGGFGYYMRRVEI